MKKKAFGLVSVILLLSVGLPVYSHQPEDPRRPRTIFSTWAGGAAHNGAYAPVKFTIEDFYRIAYISTFHWNDQQGQTPGTISLRADGGAVYGPWPAKGGVGARGRHRAVNATWEVFPKIVIPAGTYEIIDSDPATWSHNEKTGGAGMSEVMGTPCLLFDDASACR